MTLNHNRAAATEIHHLQREVQAGTVSIWTVFGKIYKFCIVECAKHIGKFQKVPNVQATDQVSVKTCLTISLSQVAKISGDDPGRDTGKVKTREFSVNWTDGDEFTEVLDGTKGRCEARYGCVSPISQVCKANLYKLFLQVGNCNSFRGGTFGL